MTSHEKPFKTRSEERNWKNALEERTNLNLVGLLSEELQMVHNKCTPFGGAQILYLVCRQHQASRPADHVSRITDSQTAMQTDI